MIKSSFDNWSNFDKWDWAISTDPNLRFVIIGLYRDDSLPIFMKVLSERAEKLWFKAVLLSTIVDPKYFSI